MFRNSCWEMLLSLLNCTFFFSFSLSLLKPFFSLPFQRLSLTLFGLSIPVFLQVHPPIYLPMLPYRSFLGEHSIPPKFSGPMDTVLKCPPLPHLHSALVITLLLSHGHFLLSPSFSKMKGRPLRDFSYCSDKGKKCCQPIDNLPPKCPHLSSGGVAFWGWSLYLLED